MNFISENFSFDGRNNKSMNVDLITFGNDFFNDIGITYSEDLSVDNSFSGNPYYVKENSDTENVVLNMLLVDTNGLPKKWDNISLMDVMDWLVTDSFKPFVSEDDEDLVYYFKVTKIVKKFTFEKIGYLEVTFKPYSNYAYYRVEAVGNSNITINNISNVDKEYKPLIKVRNSTGNIYIKNTSIPGSSALEVNGVQGSVIIDCALSTVQSSNGDNLFSKCNRKWIKLVKGNNIISVRGGDVSIICNLPIIR